MEESKGKLDEQLNEGPEETLEHLESRTWAIFFSLAVLSLTISLEAAVLVPVLPSIASDLHGTTSSTLWAGSSYLLTVAVFQPLVGALCDVVDHQKLLLGSILLFSIGVLICCLSRHIADFLVGRSIQGIGGGGILVLVNIIPTAMVSLRHRPIAIMLNQFGFVLGTILGPVLGGIIGQYTTWRWIFYLNFPLCGVALPIVVSAMKHDGSVRHFREQMRQLDYIGAILFLASTCSLLIGIIWGGEQYSWNSWQTLLPILVGILGLMAALLWEVYGTSAPFLCLSLFSIRSASATYVSTFLQGFLLFCQLYYLPIYFEGVRGLSSVDTGLTYLPITCMMIIGSLGSGFLVRETSRLPWVVMIGWILAIISSSLLFLFDGNTPTYRWVLIFLVIGAGHGILIVSLNYSLQVLANQHQVGHAMSMYTFMRALGMCVGIAVGSSLLQNVLKKNIDTGSTTALTNLKDLAAHPKLPHALLVAFGYECAVMTGVSIVGFLLSLVLTFSSDMQRDQEGHLVRDDGT